LTRVAAYLSLLERGQERSAGFLAAAARVGADLAVLVHLGVLGALGSACCARSQARFDGRANNVGVAAGVPGKDPAGSRADVGAVEVGADARGEVSDHVFGQAGVSA
jgi:hypothetical protein